MSLSRFVSSLIYTSFAILSEIIITMIYFDKYYQFNDSFIWIKNYIYYHNLIIIASLLFTIILIDIISKFTFISFICNKFMDKYINLYVSYIIYIYNKTKSSKYLQKINELKNRFNNVNNDLYIKLNEVLADNGDKTAINLLCDYYKSRDHNKTIKYYEMAALSNDENVLYNFGNYYYDQNNTMDAIKYYDKAAKLGHADALYTLIQHFKKYKDNFGRLKYIEMCFENEKKYKRDYWFAYCEMVLYTKYVLNSNDVNEWLLKIEHKTCENWEVMLLLAKYYRYELRKFDKAEQIMNTIYTNHPAKTKYYKQYNHKYYIETLYELGKYYRDVKNGKRTAASYFEKAVDLGHKSALEQLESLVL